MAAKIQVLASRLIEQLAGKGLPPQFAKLYSQHTRLRNRQPSLSSWSKGETDQRMSDVIRLIEAGFYNLHENLEDASSSFRRASEILEWLNHPDIHSGHYPLSILSSGLYQLAGYPARSSSILKSESIEQPSAKIIASFIQADFNSLIMALTEFWSIERKENSLENQIIEETVRSLGVISSHFRWGRWDDRFEMALAKISDSSKIMLYGDSYFSWVISKVTGHIAHSYQSRSLRNSMEKLIPTLTEAGQDAIEVYLRQCFLLNKSLIWPSQDTGVKKILKGESFVLCTPTGSGKTTVAEIAILKALFEKKEDTLPEVEAAPLILYLTPSRALATEVEGKLARVLSQVGGGEIVVTGLYGGTDWGPTDAWLTSDSKTVLICTFEKAEALLRFIGPLFVKRISLAIIDEAHAVQFNPAAGVINGDNRSLRLESLITRLFSYVDRDKVKLIGLSAVAKDIEEPLAKWISGNEEAAPAKTEYRSTRQIIGRLEVAPNGAFTIRYDLLDKNRLKFTEMNSDDGPYIVDPIPKDPTPNSWRSGSEDVLMRSSLFWAALHLAQKNDKGDHSSVLISVTQFIGAFAADLLDLIEEHWLNENLPEFFTEPSDSNKKAIWDKCLKSCEDYFGDYSREYKLLKKGIVVHHGKMPGLMARLLIQLIDQKIVNVVLATSTLSEGINLPFETVLVPSITRRGQLMASSEFLNLVGRAGRPGVGTEGRTLVLVPKAPRSRPQWLYEKLITDISSSQSTDESTKTVSALAALLELIFEKWKEVFSNQDEDDFKNWLENITPSFDQNSDDEKNESSAQILNSSLDALDAFLISSLVEFEKLNNSEASATEWEDLIRSIWLRSFAYYSSPAENNFETILTTRGKSLKENIYADSAERNRLYRTSLSPQSGKKLIALYNPIVEHLKTGFDYINWNKSQQFDYLQGAVNLIGQHPKFRVPQKIAKTKNAADSTDIFRWWLNPRGADKKPTDKQVSDWYNFISTNYLYKFNWGFGSILSLIIDDSHGGELKETKIEEWPETGLPWIAFWLKELITWGTLDPVAAFLLARGRFTTRSQAELEASEYYTEHSLFDDIEPNLILDPTMVRDWSLLRSPPSLSNNLLSPPEKIVSKLMRDFKGQETREFRVIPVIKGTQIEWYDCAGYPLATSDLPKEWSSTFLQTFDFFLLPSKNLVRSSKYLEA